MELFPLLSYVCDVIGLSNSEEGLTLGSWYDVTGRVLCVTAFVEDLDGSAAATTVGAAAAAAAAVMLA